MRRILAMASVAALACGGAEAGESHSAAEVPVATVAAPETEGAVHTIEMVLTDGGEYRFVPARLTIASGDVVKWVNVSGGPHNVKFFEDSIPSGAAQVLAGAMDGRTMGALEGTLMMAPQAEYEISFAGAPAGVYHYTCTPHQLLGMSATLTVQ